MELPNRFIYWQRSFLAPTIFSSSFLAAKTSEPFIGAEWMVRMGGNGCVRWPYDFHFGFHFHCTRWRHTKRTQFSAYKMVIDGREMINLMFLCRTINMRNGQPGWIIIVGKQAQAVGFKENCMQFDEDDITRVWNIANGFTFDFGLFL